MVALKLPHMYAYVSSSMAGMLRLAYRATYKSFIRTDVVNIVCAAYDVSILSVLSVQTPLKQAFQLCCDTPCPCRIYLPIFIRLPYSTACCSP